MSDLISRQAAIELIERMKPFHQDADDILEMMDNMPSAEPKHSKWIDIDEQTYTWKVRCSCCGYERSMMSTQGKYPNYCEECESRMDAE